MRLSYKWLKEYVDLSGISPEELAEKMTTAGLEVEGIEPMAQAEGLVIGEVKECEDVEGTGNQGDSGGFLRSPGKEIGAGRRGCHHRGRNGKRRPYRRAHHHGAAASGGGCGFRTGDRCRRNRFRKTDEGGGNPGCSGCSDRYSASGKRRVSNPCELQECSD